MLMRRWGKYTLIFKILSSLPLGASREAVEGKDPTIRIEGMVNG
jgi:hypothetical protein